MKTITMDYEEYLADIKRAETDAVNQIAIEYETYIITAIEKAKEEATSTVVNHLISAVKSGDINNVFKISHRNVNDLKVVAAAMLGAFVRKETPPAQPIDITPQTSETVNG